MAKYIPKEMAINFLCRLEEDVRFVNDMPTINIVHCEECKYQGIIHNHEYCKLLGGMSRRGQGNWFCADGERKE